MQLFIYTLGGIATVMVAASLAGGFGPAISQAADADKLRVFDFSLSFTVPYTFVAGLLGGALLSAASHGTDHLIVQRILATADLSAARKALVGSGILVIFQFALFLLVGTMLWAAGADNGIMASDRIYPGFVIDSLPAGLAGLVVAGILAAAMSTVSSSLNSLASAATHDFYAGFTGETDPKKLLVVGRWTTVAWAVILAGVALLFQSDQPVVVLALSIASITYGGLLGTYVLGGTKRIAQPDVMLAIVASSAVMVVVVLVKPGPLANLAWPWYVPLGTLITLATAYISSGVRGHAGVERPTT
jgi:Na+/proline symporter